MEEQEKSAAVKKVPGPLNAVSLFCGHDAFSKCAQDFGYNTFSTDIRRRKRICEPTLQANIHNLSRSSFPFESIQVLWAAVPCTAFSYGAGDFYYKNGIPNTKALPFLQILEKTLSLIEESTPDFYFIENPRGHLRYNKSLIDFLCRTNGKATQLTLSSYGFPTTKPTNIFTNCLSWVPKSMAPFGRGAKVLGTSFQNLTRAKRQTTPLPLYQDIFSHLESIPGFS